MKASELSLEPLENKQTFKEEGEDRLKKYSLHRRKGVLFFYIWQKDSGILYKRWEAMNLHMRWKHKVRRKAKTEKGRGK